MERIKKKIDKAIEGLFNELDKSFELRKVSPLLYRGIEDFLCRDGKRIRPLLFMFGYLGYTGKRSVDSKHLYRYAASIELLHDFLLIHDDVIDRSDIRRGKPTLHRVFSDALKKTNTSDAAGEGLAIVAGDIIYAMALGALRGIDEKPERRDKAYKAFLDMTVSTGIGEFIDIYTGLKKISKVKEKDIFEIYLLKTAKYTFVGPLVMGALLAGAGDIEAEKISRLGTCLGRAFQIVDDLIDIFLSTRETGKPVLSDLAESKKTLLAWKTYNLLKGADRKRFETLFEIENKGKKDLLELKDCILSTKSHEYCLMKVDIMLDEAYDALERLKMRAEYKDKITLLADEIKARAITVKKRIEGAGV